MDLAQNESIEAIFKNSEDVFTYIYFKLLEL